ncbi:isoprenylcysteine carboxylmethyltransferase family protein [Emticicia sp. 21SJ11W-3]|uniref:methyltransferase family protein n=1 Tax=Emticicia sp. 21SJ11W-3 TaxID=2916755 RepID=UPI00209CAA27|nr:isoprenylcysteine carboxylmethyltransferase family protein [Emticicia sp. 21SJ11W-3]UTA66955.1 isoprenylcysteine carboxylmethyltransferase family protein [Emticicia sp. 21SJ11W-3]
MKKILTSVLIAGLMLYCPLLDKPSFMLDIKLIIPTICSLWLLIEQKELNLKNISKHSATDGYSTILIVFVGMITQAMPLLEWKTQGQTWLCLPTTIWTYLGSFMLFCGLYLRLKAMHQLKKFFTNEVRVDKDWKLIQTGLYQYVRHPSYTGAIITMLGTSVLFESWLSLTVSVFLLLAVYLYRIKLEEKLLIAHFGDEYRAYMKRTWALIPYIF